MKARKTIWQPLALGVIFGLLAGVAMATNLVFLTPGIGTDNAIGFHLTLFLLSTAIGGPISGTICAFLFITFAAFFGSPDIQVVLSDPIVLWSNVIMLGLFAVPISFSYRKISERVKMPARLLAWAGIVIAFYILHIPVIVGSQFLLQNLEAVLPAILSTYQVLIPQMIFDLFFTCLVFIALPSRYRKPLWYQQNQTVGKLT